MLSARETPGAIGHEWIARHVPHQGAMCLIDRVTRWDDARIHCATRTHLLAENPLRAAGRLGAMCGIEYAAQAAAIHCALLAERDGAGAPAGGRIVAVRDVASHADRLDEAQADLEIEAVRGAALADGAQYEYVLQRSGATLQTGRVTLKFLLRDEADGGSAPGGRQ